MRYFLICLLSIVSLSACHPKQSKTDSSQSEQVEENPPVDEMLSEEESDTMIIDSRYTFVEALEGSGAPQDVIDQLELIDVTYLSTDEKLHQGQILTNKR